MHCAARCSAATRAAEVSALAVIAGGCDEQPAASAAVTSAAQTVRTAMICGLAITFSSRWVRNQQVRGGR
jgi:hypothetical protein